MHYKKAFTMIELIFVIVIIGILAAIAVPKLAATRDDAKIAATAHAVATAADEIAATAVSSGVSSSDLSSMSNVLKSMITQNKATKSANIVNIKMNTVNDCLKLTIVNSNIDMNLTLTYGTAGSDALCQALQNAIKAEDYPVPLRGARIKS